MTAASSWLILRSPSEVRELTKDRFDFQAKRVMVESKKKRTDGIFRAIPVPPPYLDAMNLAHSLQLTQKSTKTRKQPLWTWQATKVYYVVKEVMAEAGISGAHASAKGLRHGFAVNAAVNKVPLPLIKRWMGHSTLEMTAVYLNVIGEEEYALAENTWNNL